MTKAIMYVKKPSRVVAIQWTRTTNFSDMRDFTNHLFRIDEHGEYRDYWVYNREYDEWIALDFGDYVIESEAGLEVMPAKYFERDFQIAFAEGGVIN